MAKQQPLFTTAEEIQALIRTPLSSTLKVFVEGPDDVLIFNTIAKHKGLSGRVNFIGRGGRVPLLELYDHYILQRPRIAHTILFFADRDTWVFTGIPSEYAGVHFTKGYSIENDLFEDGQEAIMNHLYHDEKERFTKLIESVCEWFAFEVQLMLEGKGDSAKIDISLLNPNVIAPNASRMTILQIESITSEQEERIKNMKQNYTQLLRGKFLFELFQRLSQDRNHQENLPIPNISSLFSTCIATGLSNDSSNCHRIATLLQNTLNSTSSTF
jgi:hypothetical protein